jgi:hypothetical protein
MSNTNKEIEDAIVNKALAKVRNRTTKPESAYPDSVSTPADSSQSGGEQELLPCPFCGTAVTEQKINPHRGWIGCDDCNIGIALNYPYGEVERAAWNTRYQPNQPADIKRLANEIARQVGTELKDYFRVDPMFVPSQVVARITTIIESVLTGAQNKEGDLETEK